MPEDFNPLVFLGSYQWSEPTNRAVGSSIWDKLPTPSQEHNAFLLQTSPLRDLFHATAKTFSPVKKKKHLITHIKPTCQWLTSNSSQKPCLTLSVVSASLLSSRTRLSISAALIRVVLRGCCVQQWWERKKTCLTVLTQNEKDFTKAKAGCASSQMCSYVCLCMPVCTCVHPCIHACMWAVFV